MDHRRLVWRGGDRQRLFTLHDRGEIGFDRTHVLLTSLLGLWARKHLLGEESAVKVYPNY